MQFLILHLQYAGRRRAVLTWADGVIDAHPGYRVIVSTHDYLNTDGTRDTNGQRHLERPGEGQLLDLPGAHRPQPRGGTTAPTPTRAATRCTRSCRTTRSCANGGNGYLRYYEFDPAADEIDAYTYSPTLGTFRTGADQFTLAYDMEGEAAFAQIGTTQTVASGAARPAWLAGIWSATATSGTPSSATAAHHGGPDLELQHRGHHVPPVVADHPDMVVEATGPSGAVVTYTRRRPATTTRSQPGGDLRCPLRARSSPLVTPR